MRPLLPSSNHTRLKFVEYFLDPRSVSNSRQANSSVLVWVPMETVGLRHGQVVCVRLV